MKYYIYKNYSACYLGKPSYSGLAWDGAGIREQYQEYWEDKETPVELVKLLNANSIRGFSVYAVEKVL